MLRLNFPNDSFRNQEKHFRKFFQEHVTLSISDVPTNAAKLHIGQNVSTKRS